jgi:alginate biosynthesis protein AlgX
VKRTSTLKNILTGVAIFALTGTGTAAAYWLTTHEKSAPNELGSSFCPDMANEQAYKDKGAQTYATLIPGQDGWIFRTKNDFRSDWTISEATQDRLLALQEAMRANNAELVIVMPPVRGMIHADELMPADQKIYGDDTLQKSWEAYEAFINNAKSAGIDIVGIDRDEVNGKFFYMRNHHWSSDGARIAAQKAAKEIKTLPIYNQIPKISYVTKAEEPKKYKSSYNRAFQKICGTSVPAEMAQNYETVPASATANEQSLFGENGDPQVVLLGTSNSVTDSSQANFQGFLQEYLSADVLNLAYSGAGIDTSIVSYMNSAHYKNGKPKIVIWEIPGYYNLDIMDANVFSQAIPAAYGDCRDYALAKGDFKNVTDNNALYASEDGGVYGSFPAGQDPRQATLESNKDLYLHLSFAKPMKDDFKVKFHYKNGAEGLTKIVKFDRSPRYPADGEFYTLFPEMEKNAELNKVRITLPEKIKAVDVSMQICSLPKDQAPADESM